MSEVRYKSIDAVPKVIALGGTIPTQRFEHDVTNEELRIPHNEEDTESVNNLLRKIVVDVSTMWDAQVLDLANENAPCLLVETIHRRIVTGHKELPEGIACRIEWAIGVYKEV